jgi:aryl-alcohol dehydrogenase-like predicted oxidoreductase
VIESFVDELAAAAKQDPAAYTDVIDLYQMHWPDFETPITKPL